MASASASLESATRGAKSSAALEFLKSSPKKLLINGKWVPSKSGKTFETLNPSNEQVLALVAEGDKADVDEAVKHARKAYEEGKWASMSPHQRTHFLLKIAELIDKHAEELAELETLDNGKPLFESKNIDIPGAAETFRYYAGFATKIYGETNPSDPSMFNYTLREPVGVCGQIIPWNFPLLMASWKIAPALACGNVVILKPAEQTPLTALRLGELICEAGLPEGVVQIVTGFGPGAGSSIAEHPDIDKVAFTGSGEVGKMILKASAGNLKRVSLELGGKSPNIIFPDADMPSAVFGSAMGIFMNQGQVCCAGSRVFVQESVYDQFTDELSQIAKRSDSRKSAGPDHPDGAAGFQGAARSRQGISESRQGGRREGQDRRRAGQAGSRIFHRADGFHRREQSDEDRSRGNLWAGRVGDQVQGRGRRRAAG